MLVHGERLSGDGALVDLEEGILGDDPPVGRDNGTLFHLEDVARNDFRGLQFAKCTISENNGFQGQRLLQLVDNGASLEFLDETNGGVEKKQRTNDT
jgi:hypothetical protein